MWKTIRPFRYRGKRYEIGDEVPAESWPSRSYFVARRRIQFVKPTADTVSPSKVKNMTRAELNILAGQMGIEEAESYPNRDSLIAAILGDKTEDDVVEDDGLEPELEDDGLEPELPEDDSEESTPEADDAEEDSDSDDSGDENTEDQIPEEIPTVE